jgi:hypothetical protein
MMKSAHQMVYVAVGSLAGGALAKVVSPVVVADDNLLVGPSRADVTRHLAARTHYWGSAPSRDLDDDLTRASNRPVCVALPPTRNGLLSLCRVCSAALERGREVHVMDLGSGTPDSPPRGVDPAREVCLDAERIARRLPAVVRWSSLETALAATLWRLWCRRSPAAFSRFCASASTLHPQLGNLGRYHAGFFPRVAGAGQGLTLSRLDELILRQLSREWLTPTRVFVNAMTAGPELGAWLSHSGELYLAARLLAWSRHAQGRIVEGRKESPTSDSEMLAWSFRWRAGGEVILDALSGPQAAPPVAIGGAVAHDPDRPWVCRFDAAGEPYISRSSVG